MEQQQQEQWAVVQMMGHAETAGRISKPSDWGGLIRIDVPNGETYETEFVSVAAIYKIKLVSEQIARAYATPINPVLSYDTPIVTKEQHELVVNQLRQQNRDLSYRMRQLEERLTETKALPLFADEDEDEDERAAGENAPF